VKHLRQMAISNPLCYSEQSRFGENAKVALAPVRVKKASLEDHD